MKIIQTSETTKYRLYTFFLYGFVALYSLTSCKSVGNSRALLRHPIQTITEKISGNAEPGRMKTEEEHGGGVFSVHSAPIVSSAISSPSAPPILFDAIHKLYICCALSIIASAIAFFTSHILAGIKFAISGVLGIFIGKTFGVIFGSFVFSCFASFAIGVLLSWYIIRMKTSHPSFLAELLKK